MATITTGTERWLRDAPAKQLELGYAPFAKQQQFHASPAKYRLFGGAAGPGKTKALLMEAILQAHEHPGANTLLLRRTFPELEQSLLLYFRRDVPRELYKSFSESKHVVEWWNGSTTRFGYCQSESDVYQYQGAEFLFIGIDELTMFTLRQWQFLTSRNRCPVPGAFPCMAGATNPGNIGHAWVKSLWIDRQAAPGMENPDAYDPADYDFIPARVSDNPIYAADEHYLKTLRALPSHLRRAFLDGEWDVFAGQYFDRFDFSRHVVRAEQIDWKPWWPRWIAIDWGFEHPAAVYWYAVIPGAPLTETAPGGENVAQVFRPEGSRGNDISKSLGADAPSYMAPQGARGVGGTRVVTYREYITHRTPPRDLASEIVARSLLSGAAPDREKIDAIYLSPDAFARRTDEQSIADQIGDAFAKAGLPRPVPADDDRVGGWMLMYQMLDAGEWLLTDNCIELIRTLPNLIRDPARVEDVEKMDGDDPADAARYGLKSRYAARRGDPDGWRSRMPLADRLAARGYSADPTIHAMQARKFLIEETRGIRPVSFLHRRR
jgi:phage terminase large subunit